MTVIWLIAILYFGKIDFGFRKMSIIQIIDTDFGALAALFAFMLTAVGWISLVRTDDMATAWYNISSFSSMKVAPWDISAVSDLSDLGIKTRLASRIGRFS